MNARVPAILVAMNFDCGNRLRQACSAMLSAAIVIAASTELLAETPKKSSEPEAVAAKLDILGDPLPAGAIARAGSARLRPGEFVSQLVFTGDGKQLISSARDAAFCIWDAKTGKQIQRNEFSYARFHTISAAPGREPFAILQTRDGKLQLWNFLREKAGVPGDNPVNQFVQRVFSSADMEFQGYRLFAVSPDGSLLAGISSESNEISKLQFWKIEPGKQLKDLKKLQSIPQIEGYIDQIRFSADGKRLVGATRDVTRPMNVDGTNLIRSFAVAWDVESAKELNRFQLDNQNDWAFALAPDGATLAFSAQGDSLDLYNVNTGERIHRVECFGYARGVTFSKSGKLVAAGGRDQIVRVWEAASAKEVAQFAGHQVTVEMVAFSPDEQTVASGGQDGIIHLWDLKSAKEIAPSTSHGYKITALAYAPDGKQLFTGSWDDSVRIWNAESGKLVDKWEWTNVKVNSLAVSPDGKLLAVGGSQGTTALRIFDVASGKLVRSFGDQQGVGTKALAFSPDGKWLAAGNVIEASVRLWDMTTGKELRSFQHEEPTFKCLAVSRSGKFIASVGGTNRGGSNVIRIWNAATGAQINEMASPKGSVDAMAFFADDAKLVSAGMSSFRQTIVNIVTPRGTRPVPQPVNAAERSEDAVQLWDLDSGLVLSTLKGEEYREGYGARYVSDVDVSPDGRLIATAERKGTINIYQVEDGKRLGVLNHGSPVQCIAFSSDGRHIASAANDTSTLVWDVEAALAAKPEAEKSP